MRKRVYRGTPLAKFKIESVFDAVSGRRVVLGVDVGKEVMAGALVTGLDEVVANIKWDNRHETTVLLEMLKKLPAKELEVALEPSGTYGDPFRYQCLKRGLKVYRVSAKRSHDATEVFDGVPSWHDVKSAGVIARLHVAGASHEWRERREDERDLAAMVRIMAMHDIHAHNNMNRLDAMLSRHWPELTEYLSLGTTTLYRLLEASGGPQWVAKNPMLAKKRMRQWGRRFLAAITIDHVVESAKTTIGMPMNEAEKDMLREMSSEILRSREAVRSSRRRVAKLVDEHSEAKLLAEVVGVRATASMLSSGMNPVHFENPASLVKALGLNLKEKSSGKYKGQLKITKRGPGQCRFYLYLAVLRLIQRDPLFESWHKAKVARDGGRIKNSSIVALMRKLVKALWYVARGDAFDSRKLLPSRI
jgi:transposase